MANGLLVVLALASTVVYGVGSPAEPSRPIDDHIVLFLVADSDGRPLPAVEAILVGAEGEIAAGETDVQGAVEVARSQLSDPRVYAVLFLREGYFCGAMRTRAPDFLDFDEHYIELSPVALR